jgi:hypothetical protein
MLAADQYSGEALSILIKDYLRTIVNHTFTIEDLIDYLNHYNQEQGFASVLERNDLIVLSHNVLSGFVRQGLIELVGVGPNTTVTYRKNSS